MPDLLIELFSEEIPARMQARAAEDLKKRMTDGLVEAGLTYAGAHALSTPRRLTLAMEGLLEHSPTVREERKGPKVGAPDKAIEGFLRGAGLTRDQLEERETPKGAVYFATIEKPGRPAAEIIAEVLEDTIRNFPWSKSMRWGTGSLRWVRPLQSILCILSKEDGAEVVPLDIDGIQAGNTTYGHRFMAPDQITVTGFDDYAAKLKRAHVVLDPAEREAAIWHEATNQAFASGLEVVEDKGLLAEVAGLVEWPVVLMGAIDDEFLALPPEVLQTSMKEHQKFFSVRNPKTGRIEKFITVANRETADNGATILAGNQKVLSARLADAKFFWENDLRTVTEQGFEPWVAKLGNVTFHNKLGTQAARIDRIAALAREIAPVVGADADLAEQAARVAKADLSSEMVYEFPELQGLMGRYYAEAAGLPQDVANACEQHYSPLGPSDDVPSEPVSVAVALADKLDTLTGFWAIDEKPTGSKDPFALRRAALGVIRLVLGNDVRMGLRETIGLHFSGMENSLPADSKKTEHWDAILVEQNLLFFFHDRLKVFLRDQGIRHDVIDACIAMDGNDDLTLLVKRARALEDFMKSEDGPNLLQGFKRANNILAQAEEKDGVEYSYGADKKFAEDDSEVALFDALAASEGAISSAIEAEDFAAAMGSMAALRAPVDAFFEAVQVNSDNEVVRRNRLNLLSQIRKVCGQVADLTRIEG
ncbi:glycine--tRNA ligase subunit beta [Phaeobacter gallaeciensis]|uniref:Glycine--tRNA ligase beta subunit n=1 Tax=Phaeobacter gallaeciensis TaxID=60890 RepID=A0AAC9ZB52_9RHOB|nr:glycine--tRNA ligase subunit beta [Phaeobacter gallaeciensis]AHD10586.1 glycyl-tRNA synthetase beta chain [Phaeobacter gallaeciensis DSM 26640]ATE93849.1 glycyl-tRNA synthetase beta subunit [Phaeobacter gallaeciensis]ATE96330.1 glycyl-tRNA synthetase beta subunit [Phaeobacter gallaeciensis]ATF02513.1 glycyl-tRNA synthetase beta subunit [Phaeobacter gallaeciensis]ATF06893.1 glycyl-tRNA synthetase beta subunit [Phaeobacter gallaeciensis]